MYIGSIGRLPKPPRIPASAFRSGSQPSVAPAWVTSATVGQWSTIPGSTFNVQADWGGDIFQSWCDGIVNTTGLYYGTTFLKGTFLVYQSGGHTIDFDEIYAFGPLESDDTSVCKLRKIRNRTSPTIVNTEQDGSGNPVSGHTYKSLQYDPLTNTMYRMGILFGYSNAVSYFNVWKYNFNTSDPNTNQPWSKGTVTLTSPAYTSIFDFVARRIWFHPQSRNEVAYYDIDTDTLSAFAGGKTPNPGNDTGSAAYDYRRGLWLNIGNGYSLFQTTSTGNDYWTPGVTGTAPTMGVGTYGACVYDPIDDRFVVWMSAGKQLHFLTPPATNPYQGGNNWTWSSTTPAGGSTPTAPLNYGTVNATGSFGRFAYKRFDGGERIYISMAQPNAPIDFYRAA